MWSRWIEKFNLFLGRYTYRQRFIFFSTIFFIATPFPTYWLFKTLNSEIALWNTVNRGIQIQEALASVYWSMLEGELYLGFDGQKSSSEIIKKNWKSVAEDAIDRLQMLRNQPPTTVPSLGNGFATFTAPSPPIEVVGAVWLEFARLFAQNSINASSYIKINKTFFSQIVLVAEGYGFSLLTTQKQVLIANIAFKSLPEIGYQLMTLWWMERSDSSDDSFQRGFKALRSQIDQLGSSLSQLRWMNWEDPALLALEEILVDYSYLLRLISENRQSALLHNQDRLQALMRSVQQLQKDLIKVLNFNSVQKSKELHHFKTLIFFLLIISIFMIVCYLIFKVLTKHILRVFKHICELAKGHFIHFDYGFSLSDEFYPIGQAFNHMAASFGMIARKLNHLGQETSESTREITQAIAMQRSIVKHQENQVLQCQLAADKIVHNFTSMQNLMSSLDISIEMPRSTEIQEELNELEANMSHLADDSSKILGYLHEIRRQVLEASKLTLTMQKVCDQTHLLGLNASIETVYTKPYSQVFEKTTSEIQHFADHTLASTQHIQNVIDEITSSMQEATHEVSQSIKAIRNGLSRLHQLDKQLAGIARHNTQQTIKLLEIDALVKLQSAEAVEALMLIQALQQRASESSYYLDGLYHSIQHVHAMTEDLTKVLCRFTVGSHGAIGGAHES